MEPFYLLEPKEFEERVQISRTFSERKKRMRNKYYKNANCFGTSLYLMGLSKRETYLPIDIPEMTDFIEECDEKEATFMSLEEIGKFSRGIRHIMVIDPVKREVVYGRGGPGGEFMEAKREWAEEGLMIAVDGGAEYAAKYCKLNLRKLSVFMQEVRQERGRKRQSKV